MSEAKRDAEYWRALGWKESLREVTETAKANPEEQRSAMKSRRAGLNAGQMERSEFGRFGRR